MTQGLDRLYLSAVLFMGKVDFSHGEVDQGAEKK